MARAPSVLFVHNRYQERGGEDSVCEAESSLLESKGHRVGRLVFDNRDLPAQRSPLTAARLAAETVWSKPAQARLRQAMAEYEPDVVHFHNTLPLVSPAAYSAAKQAGAAVVQTLHNYRLVCPSGLLYRDGAPCEVCIGAPFAWRGIRHACYRGSRPQTALVATMLAAHRVRGTWSNDVDLYLAPSAFLKAKVVEGGLPSGSIMVKPNFLAADPGIGDGGGDYVLFVGRLTETKGVETLLEAYRTTPQGLPPLHVAGDGELALRVREAAASDSRITALGPLSREEVLAEMGGALALVFPSLWYENFPVTIAEALARGLPIVGSRLGALPEIVEEGRCGLLFRAGEATDLASNLASVSQGRAENMRHAARREYESNYGVERAYGLLLEAYERARQGAAALKQSVAPGVT